MERLTVTDVGTVVILTELACIGGRERACYAAVDIRGGADLKMDGWFALGFKEELIIVVRR